MERLLAEAASAAFKIGAVPAQRLRQARVKIMEASLIKFRRIFQAVAPLLAGDFIRRRGKMAQQPALRHALPPRMAAAFDEADDLHRGAPFAFSRSLYSASSRSA